jgi:hypothetical protein
MEAGQHPAKLTLPVSDVSPTIRRSVRITHKDEELERRVAAARADGLGAPTLTTIASQDFNDISNVGSETMQIAKAIARLREEHGSITLACGAWADFAVSEGARERALLTLDRFATALKAAHFIFDLATLSKRAFPGARQKRTEDEGRGHFQIHGTKYFVRIKERILKEEIVEPPMPRQPKSGRPRKAVVSDYSLLSQPKKYSFTPTGQLQLMVYRVQSRYETANVADTAHTVLEDKLIRLVERVEATALEHKVKEQIWEERKRERERKTAIWQAQKAQKDALLEQLQLFEESARKLDRAESLRRFAAQILKHPKAPAEFREKLELIHAMADWLDPLVARHWPEVDDVPDTSSYFW